MATSSFAFVTSDVTYTDGQRATAGRPAAGYQPAPRRAADGAARRLRPSQCPPVLARKPVVGSSDGPDEREADAVADAVLAMAAPGPIGPANAKVQRSCAGCAGEQHKCTGCAAEEEKAIQAKRMPGTGGPAAADAGAAVSVARQGGTALPPDAAAYFGPRFGHDFSGVRVHTGGDAARAARAVHARAYTVGNDIVFGAGEYAPSTSTGRRLLAHELAHTIQQSGGRRSGTVLQRLSPDFEVHGRPEDSAQATDSVFFDRNSSAIEHDEDIKLAAFAGVTLSTVTLKGYASEEETSRPALVSARLHAVATRLKAISPGTGDPVMSPDLASGTGQIGYRDVRRVEILVPGAVSNQPNCSLGADISCGPSPNDFDRGVDAAVNTLLPDAITALGNPAAAPAKDALLLFGGAASAATVKANLIKIKDQFARIASAIPLNNKTAHGHRCVNACEGDVFAYNRGVGAAARMTVGPQYFALTDPIGQGLALIHENSHGALGLATKDKAYEWQRLFTLNPPALPPAVALANADSYTRFVHLIHDPAAPPASSTQDVATALPAGSRREALEAMAWLEQWLVQGRLEVRSLYAAVNRATTAGAWDADDGFFLDHTMKYAANWFGLTKPPAVPKADDQAAIAGIYDRLFTLRRALTSSSRTLKPGPAPSVWEPGPGANVTLSAQFLAAPLAAKVNTLLIMIVNAAPFIEASRRWAYIGLVQDMAVRYGGP